ncbi:flagellar hook capping FlgD N-terminal domain-containing protein [Jannaschia sp. W003]|uniref:flagellar hook capping FlgD N-terminal domain-containing protein n=1 Tax=Jannaschia sp. W003 TaxID=2867012 RepID=UPI0021A4DC8F|nr:flagellar hook capping FlgD N-terminal domain-containing protein [Jannaschia sp. W003]UWQ21458.1 flagellar hook assembly protein FlgD [Jannaschia sp. W003]
METASLQTAAASAAAKTAPSPGQATDLASDFDTFLQLLTAQIRNQDPLEPADATQYATQLATFSNVEQGVRTNTLLTELSATLEMQGLDRLAAWIGLEARTTAPTAHDGGAVSLEAAIPPVADSATLVVSDAAGTEVSRIPVDPDSNRIDIVPTGPDGQPLAPGLYGYHVEATASGAPLQSVAVARYVPVREALIEGGRTTLVLEGGGRVGAAEVTGLRPPSGGA